MNDNLRLKHLYLLGFTSNLFFVLAFLIPLYQNLGLSYFQIFILQSFYTGFIMLFEIPSGLFSDKFGRKQTLVFANLFFVLGWASLFLKSNFISLIPYQLFIALGVSFNSGTLESYLYDSLSSDKRNDFAKIKAKFDSYRFLGMGISGIIGTYVYSKGGFDLTLKITLIASILGLILAFLLKPLSFSENKKKSLKSINSEVITYIKSNSVLKIFFLESIIVGSVLSSFFQFNFIMLKNLDFPVSLNGIYSTIIFLLTVLTLRKYSKIMYWFKSELNILNASKLGLSISILSILFIKNAYVMATLWLFLNLFKNLRGPASMKLINAQIDSSSIRATALSYLSLFRNGATMVVSMILGFLSDLNNGMSFVLVLCSFIMFFTYLIYKVKLPKLEANLN